MDEKRGMANDHGIPWRGKVPNEVQYFRQQTAQGDILMGYGTYLEFSKPFHDHTNYVATNSDEELHEGFEKVEDARDFLENYSGELIWNIGGPGLLEHTIDLHDELYISQLKGNFECTKFFPRYEHLFELAEVGEWIEENGVTYRFEIWKKKS